MKYLIDFNRDCKIGKVWLWDNTLLISFCVEYYQVISINNFANFPVFIRELSTFFRHQNLFGNTLKLRPIINLPLGHVSDCNMSVAIFAWSFRPYFFYIFENTKNIKTVSISTGLCDSILVTKITSKRCFSSRHFFCVHPKTENFADYKNQYSLRKNSDLISSAVLMFVR